MAQHSKVRLSTGLSGLDQVIKGVLPGDNFVWQVDSVEDYRIFVEPFVKHVRQSGGTLVYFRFAKHESLIEPGESIEIYELHPAEGFESFVAQIHRVLNKIGSQGFFVFDCLSDLADDWYSDRMVSNFFRLTCPYCLDIGSMAYFALYRNYHSIHATEPITWTTQLFLDVFRYENDIYLHPVKVENRYSPTMDMLHVWQGDDFVPVRKSSTISEVYMSGAWFQLRPSSHKLGIWNRTVMQAEDLMKSLSDAEIISDPQVKILKRKLIRMAITRDERVSALVKKYLSLEEILNITKRVIGTGLVGGKSVGMLLAQSILTKADERWNKILEQHDSFFVGSDVFVTFLVKNGIWWGKDKQKDLKWFLENSAQSRRQILTGIFPEYIEKQFENILDYFGHFPFIVRSSSLLEDNFGSAFAGKYESVFCLNQGPLSKRMEAFKHAVRTIYASAMSEKAMIYRAQRGLLDLDEHMALLVQRVSGGFYNNLFMPQAAGVGLSYNPYVWDESIDPEAGVVRLVFGLGTRAVDSHDDDYVRILALNAPEKYPAAGGEQMRQFTQKKVDVLDLERNQLVEYDFSKVLEMSPTLPIEIYATRDRELLQRAREKNMKNVSPWVLTFDKLLKKTDFVKNMRDLLQILQQAYDYPVDIEFTCNFINENEYRINLVQCRPFQVKDGGEIAELPGEVKDSDIVLRAQGAVIGRSRICNVDRFVYVVPSVYAEMPLKDRYAVARLIGKLMHIPEFHRNQTIMLLGPGRWGTTSPELGVPISFSEINTVSLLCEIVAMRDDLIPDVSLGTHLFGELVEMDILYLALFPKQTDNFLNNEFFEKQENLLTKFLPETRELSHAVRVVQAESAVATFHADVLHQDAVCYLNHNK